jgi:molybdenum cofactor biosynthesis protein B
MIIDVITASTSRFERSGSVKRPDDAEDLSGKIIIERIAIESYEYSYRLLSDEIDAIRNAVLYSTADAVVICGGTGLSPKDVTIEAVEPFFEKVMPGFGEIFRLRSMEEVGTRAMLSRAEAGIIRGIPVFCLPGSPSAAKLGIDLILSEIQHILVHISEV